MNEEQKRDAARDFIRSAILPLIEEVLVKKFCQSMDVIAEQNRELTEKSDRMRETLQGIIDADWRSWEELARPEEFVRWAKARAQHALDGA